MRILLCCLLISHFAIAQSNKKLMLEAQDHYDAGRFVEAEIGFSNALDKKESFASAYNLGNAQFQQENLDLAKRAYEQAIQLAPDATMKSKAAFNLGNAHLESGNLEQAIEAYKLAIKNNPDDRQAKHNLLKIKELVKQQQKHQQSQDNEEDSEQSESSEGDQSSEQKEQDQEESAGESSENQVNDLDQESPSPSEAEQDISTESMEQLLKIMEEEEKKVQQKLRKQQERPNRSTKRW